MIKMMRGKVREGRGMEKKKGERKGGEEDSIKSPFGGMYKEGEMIKRMASWRRLREVEGSS